MNLGNFDLRLLRVFDAILAEGNVTRAAARLALTQSATSQALAKLRSAFGDPLFVRSGPSMHPTAKAVAMAAPVRQALELIAETLTSSQAFDAKASRLTFRVAATDHALVLFLPELARRVAALAPGIQLVTTTVSPDRGLEYIRDGRIDLLIAYFVVTQVPGSFRTRLFFRDSYLVLAREGHPQFRGRMTLAAFAQAGHVVVAPRDVWRPGPMDLALAQAGLKRDIRVMVPHYVVVPYVVGETDLIATVPARAAARLVRGLAIASFRPPLEVASFKLEMAWDERRHHDPAHKWLRDQLIEIGKSL
jgi:DNA-binding transcriptional LysR family regulator